MDEKELVLIEGYLSINEAEYINGILSSNGIYSEINRYGNIGKSNFYRVDVMRSDLNAAVPLVKEALTVIKNANEKDYYQSNICPKCRSKEFSEYPFPNIIQKIRFFGCKVWICNRCGKVWGY